MSELLEYFERDRCEFEKAIKDFIFRRVQFREHEVTHLWQEAARRSPTFVRQWLLEELSRVGTKNELKNLLNIAIIARIPEGPARPIEAEVNRLVGFELQGNRIFTSPFAARDSRQVFRTHSPPTTDNSFKALTTAEKDVIQFQLRTLLDWGLELVPPEFEDPGAWGELYSKLLLCGTDVDCIKKSRTANKTPFTEEDLVVQHIGRPIGYGVHGGFPGGIIIREPTDVFLTKRNSLIALKPLMTSITHPWDPANAPGYVALQAARLAANWGLTELYPDVNRLCLALKSAGLKNLSPLQESNLEFARQRLAAKLGRRQTVYAVQGKEDGKIHYVGQTQDSAHREMQHLQKENRFGHHQLHNLGQNFDLFILDYVREDERFVAERRYLCQTALFLKRSENLDWKDMANDEIQKMNDEDLLPADIIYRILTVDSLTFTPTIINDKPVPSFFYTPTCPRDLLQRANPDMSVDEIERLWDKIGADMDSFTFEASLAGMITEGKNLPEAFHQRRKLLEEQLHLSLVKARHKKAGWNHVTEAAQALTNLRRAEAKQLA